MHRRMRACVRACVRACRRKTRITTYVSRVRATRLCHAMRSVQGCSHTPASPDAIGSAASRAWNAWVRFVQCVEERVR